MNQVSCVCACGQVWSWGLCNTLIFLCLCCPALWEQILGSWCPVPRSLTEDRMEGWMLDVA